MRFGRLVKILALTAGAAFLICGQDYSQNSSKNTSSLGILPDQKAISIDVSLVNVSFTAVDKKGNPVTNLREEEIRIFENSETQKISNFSHDPEGPLAIALLIDTSTSSRAKVDVEKEAAIDFVQTTIRRKKDACLLMSFDSTIDLMQPFTDDPDVLTNAIKKLKTGGGTKMFDAVQKACVDYLTKETGMRRILVLISDGDDNMSYESLESLLQTVQRANVSIFAISTNSSGFFGMENPKPDRTLRELAEETGGRAYFPKKIEDMAISLHAITDELRNQYALAYISTYKSKDGSFRNIKIESTRRDVKLKYRKGYYAPLTEEHPTTNESKKEVGKK